MMIKLKNFRCSIIIMILFCQTLFAQDSVSEPDLSAPQELKRQNTETQQSNNPQTSNTDVEDQVFIPSEEISEDAPVPFPIDI